LLRQAAAFYVRPGDRWLAREEEKWHPVSARIPRSAFGEDHDDFGLNQSKVIVIEAKQQGLETMRVLIIGDGAREHALCWKLVESPLVDELYCAPGNDGVALLAECVPISMGALQTILNYCEDNEVEFIIVDSLIALENGLVDMLNRNGYPSFGPDMGAVKLETSKAFTKEFCERHAIPTARFARFTAPEEARHHVAEGALPVVIKSDMPVAGAKVAVCRTREEADAAIAARLNGAAGAEILIEDYLTGAEIGFSVITDGNVVLSLTSTTPRWDGEEKPARPGCLSPAPEVTPKVEAEIIERIFLPTVEQMKAERRVCKGLLAATIMLTAEGPKLLDYKVHFTDPEWQVIMLRMNGDLMPALISSYDEMLYRFNPFRWHEEAAASVVVTTDGARDPEQISAAIDSAELADSDIVVFQSYKDRDLGVSAGGKDLADIRTRLRAALERIDHVLQMK
jgi:phosphoribosylamine--glycine ligase